MRKVKACILYISSSITSYLRTVWKSECDSNLCAQSCSNVLQIAVKFAAFIDDHFKVDSLMGIELVVSAFTVHEASSSSSGGGR